jgi:hypothetical protein
MTDSSGPPERPIAGYSMLSEFLTCEGYPVSRSTLQKYCSPAINIGPPREGYWGRLPIFRPSRALRWARERIIPQRNMAVVTEDRG